MLALFSPQSIAASAEHGLSVMRHGKLSVAIHDVSPAFDLSKDGVAFAGKPEPGMSKPKPSQASIPLGKDIECAHVLLSCRKGRREHHSCGLVKLSPEDDGSHSGLRHAGDAGPVWSLVMALFAPQIWRNARILRAQAAVRDTGSGTICENSTQNIVPLPGSLSKPMTPSIASTS